MNLLLTEEQSALQRAVFDFAEAASVRASSATFDRQSWRDLCRYGWATVAVPAAFGGGGLGLTEMALVIEGLSRATLATPIFSSIVEAAGILAESATPESIECLQRIIAGDQLTTVAMIERDSDPAATALTTTIQRGDGILTVNGRKRYVRDAGDADQILVFGVDDDAQAPAAALVPWSAVGIQRRRQSTTGGEPQFEVEFDQVALAATAAIADRNQAAGMLTRLNQRGAALKAAELVGLGQAALDLTLQYASTRVQFGRPIGSFQAVQHHAADMYREIQLARLLTYQAVAALDAVANDESAEGQVRAGYAVHLAKSKTSEVVPAVLRLAHQIHGGVGYYQDYPLERITRWVMASQAAYGNAAYHRRALAIQLQRQQA